MYVKYLTGRLAGTFGDVPDIEGEFLTTTGQAEVSPAHDVVTPPALVVHEKTTVKAEPPRATAQSATLPVSPKRVGSLKED